MFIYVTSVFSVFVLIFSFQLLLTMFISYVLVVDYQLFMFLNNNVSFVHLTNIG